MSRKVKQVSIDVLQKDISKLENDLKKNVNFGRIVLYNSNELVTTSHEQVLNMQKQVYNLGSLLSDLEKNYITEKLSPSIVKLANACDGKVENIQVLLDSLKK